MPFRERAPDLNVPGTRPVAAQLLFYQLGDTNGTDYRLSRTGKSVVVVRPKSDMKVSKWLSNDRSVTGWMVLVLRPNPRIGSNPNGLSSGTYVCVEMVMQ